MLNKDWKIIKIQYYLRFSSTTTAMKISKDAVPGRRIDELQGDIDTNQQVDVNAEVADQQPPGNANTTDTRLFRSGISRKLCQEGSFLNKRGICRQAV